MNDDTISRQAAIDAFYEMASDIDHLCTVGDYVKYLENMPSAQPQKCSDILDELKADDYYNYIHTGYSRFSEDDWDYLIHNAKEKEKLHERLDKQKQTGSN